MSDPPHIRLPTPNPPSHTHIRLSTPTRNTHTHTSPTHTRIPSAPESQLIAQPIECLQHVDEVIAVSETTKMTPERGMKSIKPTDGVIFYRQQAQALHCHCE